MNQPDPLAYLPPEPPEPEPATIAVGAGFDFTDPGSPLSRYFLRASHVAAVALLGLVFLLLNYVPLWHTDVWGHLKFGRWIVEHGRLPEGDPFCPFAEGKSETIHYSWLGQVGFYLVYHLGETLAGEDPVRRLEGGVEMLRFGFALLVLLYAGLLLAAFRRVSGSLPLALAGLLLFLVMNFGSLGVVRPQVFGQCFFAAFLLALSRPVLSRRSVFLLPALLVLWANCHGSFPIALALLGAFLLGRVLEAGVAEGWGPRSLFRDSQVRRLLVTLGVSAVAVAILNPHGPAIYRITWHMADNPNVLAMDEWQPLGFGNNPVGKVFFLGSLALLAGVQMLSPRWYSPTALIVLALFGVQPLRHQRLLLWWAMLAPWLGLTLGPALRERWARRPGGGTVPSFRKTLVAGVLAFALLGLSIPAQWLTAGRPGRLDRILSPGTPWPLAAQLLNPGRPEANWLPALRAGLKAHYPGGKFVGCIFPSETLGDYLLWALTPDTPVFVYTHVHLFSSEHWRECAAVKWGTPDWRKVLDRNGINLIIVESTLHPHLRNRLYKDPAWELVLDEANNPAKPDQRSRWLIALRKVPIRTAALAGGANTRRAAGDRANRKGPGGL